MSQIFLFTGENLYELRQERSRWVQEFSQKHGMENLLNTDVKSLSFTQMLDEISVAPFIAEKRLVVVDGIPKLEKEQVALLANSIHPQVLLLFVEPKPDKRLSATKELLKIATVKTFQPLRGSALIAWLCTLASQAGSTLSTSDAEFLISLVGQDQTLLANEVTKLATFADDRPISREDIEQLVMLSTEQAVWQLMDLLGAAKQAEALQYTNTLLKRGENAHGLWSMFLWMVAQFSQVATFVLEGNTNTQDIAKSCGMHPNTARSLTALARSYTKQRLQQFIHYIAESDVLLKTGGFKATDQSPEELNAVLDTRIAAMV